MSRSLAALVVAALSALAPAGAGAKEIFRLRDGGVVSTGQLVEGLKAARVIFFGERHTRSEDHVAQRTLIQALHEAGVPLAIGMEMFRRDAQPELDRWVGGELDGKELRALYERNWSDRLYGQYTEILLYARQERIPLVGLNIDEGIVSQVSRGGFRSLSEEQRRTLGVDSCDVSERYADLLRRVRGGEATGGPAFANFCEAQVAWDAAMARTIADFLAANPGRTMLVMCGNFHAWRHGIPERLAAFTDVPVRIILPASDAEVSRYEIFLEDADYVWFHE